MRHIEKINDIQANAIFEDMRGINSPTDLLREAFNLAIDLYAELNGEGDEKVTVEDMRARNGDLFHEPPLK
jgi:hypothetical protein